MLNFLIKFSLRYRMLVVIVSVMLIVYGSYLASIMPIDVFPDLDRPRVVIITECPGLATEEVESLVAQPIEIGVLGASGVQAVRSQSTAGLAVIYVEFSWETEIRAARQTIQERLAAVTLPTGIRAQMTPPASIMGQIVIAGMFNQRGPRGGELESIESSDCLAELVISEDGKREVFAWRPIDRHRVESWKQVSVESLKWNPDDAARATAMIDGKAVEISFRSDAQRLMDLRTDADWVVRPRLLKISGVAEVFIQGGDRKQYQVLVDPTALLEHDITLGQVETSLSQSNVNTSGGFATTGEIERPIRVLGRLGPRPEVVIKDLTSIPVKTDSIRPVLLEDVATIAEGAQFKRGDGSIDGFQGTVFTIVKQPHVDTRQLTQNIQLALEDIEASLPANIVINPNLFQLKNFIDRSIFNVGEALVFGAALVLIILFLFLLNFRTTFVTLTAIPMSLVITTLVFRILGTITGTQLSINVMTLGGIAVAMGELVDDAIVDVENILRRLRENNASASPKPVLRVIYEASIEIRSSIVFGTVVVILVFLPLFALTGVEGRLFAPLGIAYIVSILASLLVSLTLTPVLSYYLLRNAKASHASQDGPLLRFSKWLAGYLIRFSMRFPKMLLAGSWIVAILAAIQFSSLGRNFLPQFDEGSILVNVTLPPGSSLDASNQVSHLIDMKFRQRMQTTDNPAGEILHFVRRTGRAEMDEHAAPVNAGEYILSMNPAMHQKREQIIAQILAELRKEVPGVDIEVEQPLSHLISHMVSGVYAQIAVKVVGDDLDTLIAVAEQLKSKIKDVRGVTPPVIEPIQQTPELQIRLLPEALARYGLTREYVGKTLQTALQGEVVSQVLEAQRRFDLLVRLEQQYRTDYANLGRLRIDLPNDQGQVELSSIAEITEGVGPNSVNRENARRRIVIRCNTQGRDLASAVAEIKNTIGSQFVLPSGYYIEYSGQFESQQRATMLIGLLAVLSGVGMFVVLMILFPSVRIVLQILNALPTAFIGGVFALVLTGQSVTVASLVGFISLGGIAVRNGILLVTHYIHLMKFEGQSFSHNLILRGSLERLAPVMMTALTAGIGLLPLVIQGQEPGREILYPVASVILGGLITSTFCEFLIHPGLFLTFSGQDAVRLANGNDNDTDFLVDNLHAGQTAM